MIHIDDWLRPLGVIFQPGIARDMETCPCGWCGAIPEVRLIEQFDAYTRCVQLRGECHGETIYVNVAVDPVTLGPNEYVNMLVKRVRFAVRRLFPFDRYFAQHWGRAWAEVAAFLPMAQALAGARP